MKNHATPIMTSIMILTLTILFVGNSSSTSFGFEYFTEKKVPGVYFVEFDASALITELPEGAQVLLPSVYTIHDDGSVHGVDATDGGLGLFPGFLIQTPTQGVWKTVSKRSIRMMSLYFGFLRPEDEEEGRHGKLAAVSRLTANVYFNRDYNSGTGLALLRGHSGSRWCIQPRRTRSPEFGSYQMHRRFPNRSSFSLSNGLGNRIVESAPY